MLIKIDLVNLIFSLWNDNPNIQPSLIKNFRVESYKHYINNTLVPKTTMQKSLGTKDNFTKVKTLPKFSIMSKCDLELLWGAKRKIWTTF